MESINEARLLLNDIDEEMKELFIKRMNIIKEVALYKERNNLPIFDEKREIEMKERLSKDTKDLQFYYLDFLNIILSLSKKYQKEIIGL